MNAFGPYRVVRPLGAGAFGEVLEVEHEGTGVRYALKALLPFHTAEDRARFAREAEALGRLQHPHVGRVIGAELEGPRPYLVQELLTGGDLAALLQARGPLPLGEALRLCAEVASGLEHAHAAGVLHRDLKPQNVLLDAAGRAKIVDFGLAYLSDRSRLTETHTLLGTPAYMSPEQARGEALDERSDVYAIGALLFALVTGQAPFSNRGSVFALLAAVTEEPPPNPSDLRAELPRWLDALCQSALAKDPARRPAGAGAFAAALKAASAPPPLRSAALRLGLLLGGAALLTALGVWRLGSASEASPLGTPGSPQPQSSVAAQTERRLEPVSPRRALWERDFTFSSNPAGAWIQGERLIALDGRGRAQAWELGDLDAPPTPLFDLHLQPQDSPREPLGLYPHAGGWVGAIYGQCAFYWHPERELARTHFGSSGFAYAGGVALHCGDAEAPFVVYAGIPGEPLRELFSVEGVRRGTLDEKTRLTRVVFFPAGQRVVAWSRAQAFVGDLKGRVLPLARGTVPRDQSVDQRGSNERIVVAPDGDRFALAVHGDQVFLGKVSDPAAWELLDNPLGGRWVMARHQFSAREVAFGPEGARLYVLGARAKVSPVGAFDSELWAWDLSAGPKPRMIGVEAWEIGEPASLSLSASGDLLAIASRSGRIKLVGVDTIARPSEER